MKFGGVVALCAGIIAAAVMFNVVMYACPGLVWGYLLLVSLGAWWTQALLRNTP